MEAMVGTVRRLVLAGMSGVGKSTAGRLAADRLGWRLVDTDATLEAESGTTIPEWFRTRGEASFRQAERALLAAVLADDTVVVATGGGAVADEAAWASDLLGAPGTLVVSLDAEPETSIERMREQLAAEGGTAERPLLAGNDPLARFRALKASRRAAYDRAALTLVVDGASPEQVAAELAWLASPADGPDVTLRTATAESAIHVRPGLATRLGELVRERWPAARTCWVVSDENVAALHGNGATSALEDAGFVVRLRAVPAGEGSKSVAGVSDLWDWMLGGGAERSDVVVALGGGVVGDLAGFAAATALRGIGLVQVPTSLLATVDSSVGGKTGINHPAGKNLVGAFLQPPLVVIDTTLLKTAPPRELRSGWAEIVKHGIIQRSTPGGERNDLGRFLARNADRLSRLEEPTLAYLIRRNVALKAAVVEADERETGMRAYLNFGHTLGHAIEASDYALLHGEAIALGMRAAARIGVAMGTCDEATAAAIDAGLDRFGLPARHGLDPARLVALIGSDKKRSSGRQRWVLPLTGGGVEIRDDVPASAVEAGLDAVRS